MVNSGPSTGCLKCREQHTKCDKARPACRRCIIRGHGCPGYRDTCGVVFKDESRSVAERQVRRARTKLLLSPSAELVLDPQTVAIPFFFNRHIFVSEQSPLTSRGHFDFLIPIFSGAEPSSPVATATLATAARSMCSHFGLKYNTPWQVEKDLAASQAIMKAIANPEESLRDETLLAVLCLDFGTHFSQLGTTKTPSRAHLDGALALIHHRKTKNFESPISRSLFAATRSNVLLQSLWWHDERSEVAFETFPDVDVDVDSPILKLHYLLMKGLKLERLPLPADRSRDRKGYDYRNSYHYKLARHLQVRLYAWLDALPRHWRYLFDDIEGDGTPPAPISLEHVPKLHVISLLGQWQCVKLTVLRTCYRAIELRSGSGNEESITESKSLEAEAQAVAEKICRLIKYLQMLQDRCTTSNSHNVCNDTAQIIRLNVLVRVLAIFDGRGPGSEGLQIAYHTMDYFRREHQTMMEAVKGASHYSMVASKIPIA